jgi:hypothetical protein
VSPCFIVVRSDGSAATLPLRILYNTRLSRHRDVSIEARRRGREVEGTPLLREHLVKNRIEGSNPSVSAKPTGFVQILTGLVENHYTRHHRILAITLLRSHPLPDG